MDKLKAYVIEPVGGHGGMNYYNIGLAQGIRDSGGETVLFTCDETRENSTDRIQIVKAFRGVYGRSNKVVRAIRYFKAVVGSALRIRRDNGRFCHLHFFQYGFLELITCSVLRLLGIKIVSTVHDVEAFSKQRGSVWQAMIFKLCSEMIVHNEFSKGELKRVFDFAGIEKPVTVIPHGNYLPFVKKKNKHVARNNLGLEPSVKVVLFFGQIKKVKGLDVLIEAMPKVLDRHPDAIFLIAGKVWKDSFDSYQALIDSNGVNDSVVKHVRYIPDEQVDDYYCSADVVALPYLRIYQSGVLLMAMSYGCCTVSSALEPMREVIRDGVNGYLFSPGSSSDLANKINLALEVEGDSVSRSAIDTMTSMHDWAVVGKKHMEVYRRHA